MPRSSIVVIRIAERVGGLALAALPDQLMLVDGDAHEIVVRDLAVPSAGAPTIGVVAEDRDRVPVTCPHIDGHADSRGGRMRGRSHSESIRQWRCDRYRPIGNLQDGRNGVVELDESRETCCRAVREFAWRIASDETGRENGHQHARQRHASRSRASAWFLRPGTRTAVSVRQRETPLAMMMRSAPITWFDANMNFSCLR
jgi:hypothetical protein